MVIFRELPVRWKFLISGILKTNRREKKNVSNRPLYPIAWLRRQ